MLVYDQQLGNEAVVPWFNIWLLKQISYVDSNPGSHHSVFPNSCPITFSIYNELYREGKQQNLRSSSTKCVNFLIPTGLAWKLRSKLSRSGPVVGRMMMMTG